MSEMLLTIGEDGKATLYDGTYDITIHCESQEEQDEVKRVLQNVPHWIPTSERLPKISEDVLLSYFDEVTIGWLNSDGSLSIFDGQECVGADEVSAWMPLPEPYKGVTE